LYYTGISHGCWPAWRLAIEHPERMRAFVCCDGLAQYVEDPSVIFGKPDPNRKPQNMVGNREMLSKFAWNEPWPTNDPRRLAKRAANVEEHIEILMARTVEEMSIPSIMDLTCLGAKSEAEMYAKLAEITIPVLIWNGGKDKNVPVENALKVAQTIPGASLLTYQHLGHGGADECPWIAARDCDRFFRDTEGRIL